MEKLKLRIWKQGGNDMLNMIKLYPATKEFYRRIAEKLGCKMDDIVCLSPYNPKDDGIRIYQFFPIDKSILIQNTDIPREYGKGDSKGYFCFSDIKQLTVEDTIFIAEDYEDSGIIIYANPATIDVLEDDEI